MLCVKNVFGQDITIGSIVGLGIRDGNYSEQRVGIVLELFSKPRHGRDSWFAKCVWVTPYWTWNPELRENELSGWTKMTSKQMFRFFLLDEASLDPEVLQTLDDAYQNYLLEKPSTFVPDRPETD